MNQFEHYEKGYSPSALQHKYSLTYEQGCELAQDFKRKEQDREILKSFIVRHHPEMEVWIRKNFGRVKQ